MIQRETFFNFHNELKGAKYYLNRKRIDIWELYALGLNSEDISLGKTRVKVMYNN